MAITVDTNILIWGVRGVSTLGQESRIPVCRRLFEWLQERDEIVVLTADCVEEYLVGGNPDQISSELAILQERFIILDYNATCWLKSADIRSDAAFMKEYKETDPQKTRTCIKSDIRIVATALAHRVDKIYSDDKGVRAIAKRSGILVAGVPTIEEMLPDKKKAKNNPNPIRKLFDDIV